jgi:hypothetical protein
MKKYCVVSLVLGLLLVLSLGSYPTISAQEGSEIPDLKGTWVSEQDSGIRIDKAPDAQEVDPLAYHSEGPAKNAVTITMKIDFQDGASFSGTRGNEMHTETLVGAISSDNESLYMTDEDGFLFGKLLTNDKMEVIYLESGDYAQVVVWAIYNREK